MTPLTALVLGREGSRFRILRAGAAAPGYAVLRGRAKRDDERAVAGDRVRLDPAGPDGLYGIAAVLDRTNILARGTANRRGRRAIAANVDRVFVLTASTDPEPLPQLLDRLLVLAAADRIPAAVVVNKIDRDPGMAIRDRMVRIGYEVYPVSAKTGEGLDRLFAVLHAGTSVMTGPSGAGKSTLLNTLEPGLALPTAETSMRSARGRHTTVAAVMVPLRGGGFLIDTPGMSEAALSGIGARELAEYFPEWAPFRSTCRFADCLHDTEPGCTVRDAVGRGAILEDRYASYRVMLEEIQATPEAWE